MAPLDLTQSATASRMLAASRLSEAIFGLRYLRNANHPHVDSAWFRTTIGWSATSGGSLLTAICGAPDGVPGFLLDRVEAASSSWADQLYGLISLDDGRVEQDLRQVFAGKLPPGVARQFRKPREGLAEVIHQLDLYVTSVLEPMWLVVSMALTDGIEGIQPPPPSRADDSTAVPDAVIPTVFGIRRESFDRGDRSLLVCPIDKPDPVLYGEERPRFALAQLVGYPRTVILYSLEGAMTAKELSQVTGQRRKSTLHHLEVLVRTRLIAELATRGHLGAPKYCRTALGDELLGL